jgi:coenzyme F420-reducing hydrogenase delta subunit
MNFHIFYCANCLDANDLRQGLQIDEKNKTADPPDSIKIVSLPCSGKVNLLYLLKAFEKGADGVLLVTCPQKECKYLEGNLRARKRAEAVDGLLKEIGLSENRMRMIQKNEPDVRRIMAEIAALKKDLSREKRAIPQ